MMKVETVRVEPEQNIEHATRGDLRLVGVYNTFVGSTGLGALNPINPKL